MVGDTACEYIHPDDREAVRETFEDWKRTPADRTVEYRARHADGSWRWLEARGTRQFENPAVDGYVIDSRDITAGKRREQQLARTRDLMSRMEKLADVSAWECIPESEKLTVTAGGKRIYGIDPDAELTLAGAFELPHPADRARLSDRFETCWETGKPYEIGLRVITNSGERWWVTTRGERVQHGDAWPGVGIHTGYHSAEETGPGAQATERPT